MTAPAAAFEIPEASRHRGLRPEVAVVLADGQAWRLERPRIGVNEPGEFEARLDDYLRCTIDPPPEPIVDRPDDHPAIRAINAERRAEREEAILERIAAEVDLASALLRRNYDLTSAEAEDLIRFDYGDPDEAAELRMRTLMRLATGRNPDATYIDYGRATLLANGGIPPDPRGVLLEDFWGAMELYRKSGRTMPAEDFVGWARERAERRAAEEMFGAPPGVI